MKKREIKINEREVNAKDKIQKIIGADTLKLILDTHKEMRELNANKDPIPPELDVIGEQLQNDLSPIMWTLS